jgi:hypothetical protein
MASPYGQLDDDPSIADIYVHFNFNEDAVLAYQNGVIDENGEPTEEALEEDGENAVDYSNPWMLENENQNNEFEDEDDDSEGEYLEHEEQEHCDDEGNDDYEYASDDD